jgi:diguanylate cyclase (GGDEF)-like protein
MTRLANLVAPTRSHEPDSDQSAAMRRWLGIFFASGGTFALVALALPHGPTPNTTATAFLSASAYPVAAFLLWTRRPISTVVFHVLTATGTLIVTTGIMLGQGSSLASVSPMFYLWVPIFAMTYFSTRAAIAHVVWIALSYSVAVRVDAGRYNSGQWVVVVGVLVVTSLAVHRLVDAIRRLARTDPLTGIANRRAFDARVHEEIARAQRARTSLCVVIIDLDYFKHVNDEFGHQAGDRLLVQVAQNWLRELRAVDCLARYGGDEFALLLPDADTHRAASVVARLRSADPTISFCSGLAAYAPGDDLDSLISRADGELYETKRQRVTATEL